MVTVLVAVVVGIALSYLSARYLGPDPENPIIDDTPTTIAGRGSFVPILYGTRRTGPVFAFAGQRRTEQIASGGGGGKGGGGAPESTSTVYYEQGWHAICVGPATKLMQIRANANNELGSVINVSDSPSGTGHKAGSSNFRFYFGECTQPVDPEMFESVGISSRWPNLVFAYWDERKLGGSPTWQNIDYEVQVQPIASSIVLTESAAWLDNGTSDGWNPAHALYQLLTASFPQGGAIPPAQLDINRFEQMGVLLENEHLPINIIGRTGVSLAKMIADLFQDVGILMPQVGDVLVPWLIRDDISPYDEVIPVWDSSILETPLQEVEIADITKPLPSRLLFQFPNKENRYRKMDMVIDYDSNSEISARMKTDKIDMPSITQLDVAAKVVDRRQVELLADQRTFKGNFLRDARMISSGQRFDLKGVGRFRVLAIKRLTDDPGCQLEYMLDPFGDAPSGFEPTTPNPEDQIPDRNSSVPAADDLAFTFYEPPCTFVVSQIALIFGLRLRDNIDIESSGAWVSTQDVTYANIGSAGKNANGGLLTEAIDIDTNVILEVGPTIDLESIDASLFSDFDSDSASWLTGSQNMIVNGEWFYVRSLTALGGVSYRLNGVVRARHDTEQQAHIVTDRVWIFKTINIEFLSGSVVIGQSIYYKSVPVNTAQTADITGIVPVNKNIDGRTLEPLSINALRTGNVLTDSRGNVFVVAADTVIDWNYRVCAGSGVALGEQVAGFILNTTDLPSDGESTLEILDAGDVVVRTETIAADTSTYTYTTANRTADFGGEPALFKVRVTQHDLTNVRSADPVTIVILQEQ